MTVLEPETRSNPIQVMWWLLSRRNVEGFNDLVKRYAGVILQARNRLAAIEALRPGLVAFTDEANEVIALAERFGTEGTVPQAWR